MQNLEQAPFRDIDSSDSEQLTSQLYREGDYYVHARDEVNGKSPDDLVRDLAISRELFDELTDEYDIKHAPFLPVIGFVKGVESKPGSYIVSTRVDGVPCVSPESDVIPTKQFQATRDLISKLTRYAVDKRGNEEKYLYDIFRLEQYLYDEKNDEMVLVDIEPFFSDNIYVVAHCYRGLEYAAQQVFNEEELGQWKEKLTKIW